MLHNLPKIKGAPLDLMEKIDSKRSSKLKKIDGDHSKVKLEYLNLKIKFDTLLDLSMSVQDKNLSPSLVVDKKSWKLPIQQSLLNGQKVEILKENVQKSLKSLVFDKLSAECENLLRYWNVSNPNG